MTVDSQSNVSLNLFLIPEQRWTSFDVVNSLAIRNASRILIDLKSTHTQHLRTAICVEIYSGVQSETESVVWTAAILITRSVQRMLRKTAQSTRQLKGRRHLCPGRISATNKRRAASRATIRTIFIEGSRAICLRTELMKGERDREIEKSENLTFNLLSVTYTSVVLF